MQKKYVNSMYLKLNNHLPIYILTSATKFKEHCKGFFNVQKLLSNVKPAFVQKAKLWSVSYDTEINLMELIWKTK